MSGTWPSDPVPVTVTLESYQPAYKTTAHSLRRIVRNRGAQRWMFILRYPPMTHLAYRPLQAFLLAQQGVVGTFTFYPPAVGENQGTGAGSPQVNGAVGAGNTSVASKGWTAGDVVFKAGDFVKFQSHAKVYMLTADVTADGGGLASLPIQPPLMQALSNNETIVASNVPFVCAVDNDDVTAERQPGGWVSLSEIHLLEVP